MKVKHRKLLHKQSGWAVLMEFGKLAMDGRGNRWVGQTRTEARAFCKRIEKYGFVGKPIKVTLTIWTDEKGNQCTN